MKKLLTTASVLVGLTISFNLLANSDIHLDHATVKTRANIEFVFVTGSMPNQPSVIKLTTKTPSATL
jgi:hypothetical protein